MFHINWTTTKKEHTTHSGSLPHTDLPTKAKLKAHLPREVLLDLPSPFCSDLLKHVFQVDLWLLALEIITWVSWDIVGLELNSLWSILESLGGKPSRVHWCQQSCHYCTFCGLGRSGTGETITMSRTSLWWNPHSPRKMRKLKSEFSKTLSLFNSPIFWGYILPTLQW